MECYVVSTKERKMPRNILADNLIEFPWGLLRLAIRQCMESKKKHRAVLSYAI